MIKLICVGKIKEKYLNEAIDEYKKRLSKYTKLDIIELPDSSYNEIDKVKKEPLFIPVMARISIPFNLENQEEKENKLQEKEVKAKEHLEEMVDITRHLSYSDINLLKKNMPEKTITLDGKEKEQDERQK